jgi:hypothetical protein
MLRKTIPLLLALALAVSGCLNMPEATPEENEVPQDLQDPGKTTPPAGEPKESDKQQDQDTEKDKDEKKKEDADKDKEEAPAPLPDPETWHLSWQAHAGGCNEGDLVRTYTGNESECRAAFAPLSPVLHGANDTLWFSYTATEATEGHAEGTPVEGNLRMFILGARMGTIHAQLLVDDVVVANTTQLRLIPVDEPTDDPLDLVYRNVTFSMVTHQEIPEGAELTFRFAMNMVTYFRMMSSEDAPSGFAIGHTETTE